MRSITVMYTVFPLLLGWAALAAARDEERSSPASVANGVPESQLAVITLTPEARQRLGIKITSTEMKNVRRTRLLGGEVMVPAGKSAELAAPVAGTVLAPKSGVVPVVGHDVTKGQELFRLMPVLSNDRLGVLRAQVDVIEAEGQSAQAEVRVEAARIKVQRADKLRADNAGSARTAEEAHAEMDLAMADLKAARARLRALKATSLEPDPNSSTMIELNSPFDGILQALPVSAGHVVAAGTAILEVISMDPLWIRVPVYVGDLHSFDLQDGVSVTELSRRADAFVGTAAQVPAPVSADLNAATVNVYFEIENAERRLRPGQRISVVLPLHAEALSLVVPWSAVVFDYSGDAWVYEEVGQNSFARRRADIQYILEGQAILARGLRADMHVVTVGAAELFGTEFGVGH